SSGVNDPDKAEIRTWGTYVESGLLGVVSGTTVIHSTLASLSGNQAPADNAMGWVIGDPVVANNGIYEKRGDSGTGDWVRRGDLPYSYISATNTAAGTANA